MSKKSRKRNKKILGLLAAGLGAAALMKGRGKKKFGTDAGFLKSGAAGGASLSSPPIGGTDHIPVAPKVVADTDSRFDTRFSKPSQELISKGHRSRALQAAANAPKGIYPPGSVPMQRMGTGPRRFSKGGSVKGAGIAKRGFGRALKKGK